MPAAPKVARPIVFPRLKIMPSPKAEYKNAVRSRKFIRQAFLELLQEKSPEKITVTDIITRADINRGTFYAHYQDLPDLFEQVESELLENLFGFLEQMDTSTFFSNPLPLLLQIAAYLQANHDFYRLLARTPNAQHLWARLKTLFVGFFSAHAGIPLAVRQSSAFLVRVNFFAGGVVNLLQVWFCGELPLSAEQMAKEVAGIITSFGSPIEN
ncbi:MAG TPA: TetR/AcrR family transcriptional regulator [Anaerolineales bacterium]|nr:TetR/AcrR family transcriptional regulator [Anaerolineales bacterium]